MMEEIKQLKADPENWAKIKAASYTKNTIDNALDGTWDAEAEKVSRATVAELAGVEDPLGKGYRRVSNIIFCAIGEDL